MKVLTGHFWKFANLEKIRLGPSKSHDRYPFGQIPFSKFANASFLKQINVTELSMKVTCFKRDHKVQDSKMVCVPIWYDSVNWDEGVTLHIINKVLHCNRKGKERNGQWISAAPC